MIIWGKKIWGFFLRVEKIVDGTGVVPRPAEAKDADNELFSYFDWKAGKVYPCLPGYLLKKYRKW